MKKTILFLILIVLSLNASDSVGEEVELSYFKNLDSWVQNGGDVNTVQEIVVENCGKLVMITVDSVEKLQLSTIKRDEFDWRLDVCVKMTVNRVHPQPEFENPKIINMICNDDVRLFQKMCKQNGFR